MRHGLRRTFAVPLLLLVATLAALVAGLVANGWPDAAATTVLAAPIAIILVCLLPRRRIR